MAELWNTPLPFNCFTRKALKSLQYTSVLRKCSLKAGTEYSPLIGMQDGWFWHLRLKYRFAPFTETMASIIWFCFSLFSTCNLYSFLFKTWQPVWLQRFFLGMSKNSSEAKQLTLTKQHQIKLFAYKNKSPRLQT